MANMRGSSNSGVPETTTKASAHVPTGGATVSVACKIPNGLVLRLFEMVDDYENVMGGGQRQIKRAVQVGESVTINGSALGFGVVPEFGIVGGYAITHGVDEEFFTEWLRQNKDHPAVVNNLIFASSKPESVTARAREMKTVRSNLEPLTPDNDERIASGTRNITKISSAAASAE